MYLTTIETALPDVESGECGYIELDTDGYLTLPNDKVGSLALSFWVKSNTDANIYVSDKSSTSTNEWKHVSFIFVSDGSDVDIKFSPANYYIYKVKMEEGSKITGWSLSPDDVLNSIDTLTVRVNKAEQLISPEGIISTVKNSEMYQDDINGIRGRLDVAEQKITKDAIVSTVKSGIDGEFLVSEINQSAGQVLIKADRIELDGDVLVNKIVAKGDVIDQVNSELLLEGNSIALTAGHFTIDSENFKLDSAGNAEFSGEIKGSSGEFTKGFYVNCEIPFDDGYDAATQTMKIENGEFELSYVRIMNSTDDPDIISKSFLNKILMKEDGIDILTPTVPGANPSHITLASPYISFDAGVSGKVTVSGYLDVTRDVNLIGDYLNMKGKNTIQATDDWLRLNGSNQFPGGVYTPGHLLCSGYLRSDGGYFGHNKDVIQTADPWLRLNNSGHFTSGIYTPLMFRADKGVAFSHIAQYLRMAAFSTVITPNGNSGAIVTAQTINSWMNVDNSNCTNTIVLVANGDGVSCTAHYEGATLVGDVWYAVFDRNIYSVMRINCLVVYVG